MHVSERIPITCCMAIIKKAMTKNEIYRRSETFFWQNTQAGLCRPLVAKLDNYINNYYNIAK